MVTSVQPPRCREGLLMTSKRALKLCWEWRIPSTLYTRQWSLVNLTDASPCDQKMNTPFTINTNSYYLAINDWVKLCRSRRKKASKEKGRET